MKKIIFLLLAIFSLPIIGALIRADPYLDGRVIKFKDENCKECKLASLTLSCSECEIEKYCVNFCTNHNCTVSNYYSASKRCVCDNCKLKKLT